MPLGVKPSAIADPALRRLMEEANAAFDDGRNRECVERCAEAYLRTLQQFPAMKAALQKTLSDERIREGIEARIVRVAPFMWPRFAAKLDMSGSEPRIVFERERPSYSETVEYYEFTLNLIVEAEQAGTAAGG
ncbi:MAG: hypothetical protein AB7R89_25490 [Dehalococcoidia bacterium]